MHVKIGSNQRWWRRPGCVSADIAAGKCLCQPLISLVFPLYPTHQTAFNLAIGVSLLPPRSDCHLTSVSSAFQTLFSSPLSPHFGNLRFNSGNECASQSINSFGLTHASFLPEFIAFTSSKFTNRRVTDL